MRVIFAITQIEGDIESTEDEDYIQQLRQALKEFMNIKEGDNQ